MMCVGCRSPSPPSLCVAASSADARFAEELFNRVNAERARGGDCKAAGRLGASAPLMHDEKLACAARAQASDMVERHFFDHKNPDGEGPAERARRAGYLDPVAENLAWSLAGADEVMRSWLASPGHCRNLLNPLYVKAAAAHHGEGAKSTWVLVLGSR
jgi:uncharacterized protein YkwD